MPEWGHTWPEWGESETVASMRHRPHCMVPPQPGIEALHGVGVVGGNARVTCQAHQELVKLTWWHHSLFCCLVLIWIHRKVNFLAPSINVISNEGFWVSIQCSSHYLCNCFPFSLVYKCNRNCMLPDKQTWPFKTQLFEIFVRLVVDQAKPSPSQSLVTSPLCYTVQLYLFITNWTISKFNGLYA